MACCFPHPASFPLPYLMPEGEASSFLVASLPHARASQLLLLLQLLLLQGSSPRTCSLQLLPRLLLLLLLPVQVARLL